MPYVHVRVGGPLTVEQRKQIAREISATLQRVASKPLSAIDVVFEEVDRDKWVVAGELLSDKDAPRPSRS